MEFQRISEMLINTDNVVYKKHENENRLRSLRPVHNFEKRLVRERIDLKQETTVQKLAEIRQHMF